MTPFVFHSLFLASYYNRVPDSSHYLITDEGRAATPAHTDGETHKRQTGVEKQISVPSVTPERFVIQSLNDIGHTPRGIIYERNFYPTSAREGGFTMHMLPRTKPRIVQLSETTFKITATCIREISKDQNRGVVVGVLPRRSLAALVVRGRENWSQRFSTVLTEHLTEEQLLQVTENGDHQLRVHLEEGFVATFLTLTFSLRVSRAPSRRFLSARFGFAGKDIVVGLAVIGCLAQGFYFRIRASRDPTLAFSQGTRCRKWSERLGFALEEGVVRFGQVAGELGTNRPSTGRGFGLAHLQMSRSSFAHVVTPFGLIKLHLLLGICQHGQVGQGPLLAEVGWHRDASLRAAHTVHLQLAPCHTLWHTGLAPLGSHACTFT